MDQLEPQERVLVVIRIFLRLYLTSTTQNHGEIPWTIPQLAIDFEIEQASRFREKPHTVSSLAKALELPAKTVSRLVREKMRLGTLQQIESETDGRVKYILPTDDYYKNGGDAILRGIEKTLTHCFGDSWKSLEVLNDVDLFPSADLYTNAVPDINTFREFFRTNRN